MPEILGTTKLGGLLGSPVSHSISPRMHNDSFEALGLDMVYLCFDVTPEHLPEAVAGLKALGTYGFNLTMPDKEAVIPLLDHLTRAAQLIGAVNTVSCKDGILTGHNTDGAGYMKSIREAGIEIKGKEMTLMGCGGAASAIAVQAALDGVQVLHLACRRSASWPKAVALADKINAQTSCRADLTDLKDTAAMRQILSRSVLLTNATSAGMGSRSEETPLTDSKLLHEDLTVSDIIYNPRETRLMREAARAGCRTMNGLYMLLWQGEEAFRIWTGKDMPVSLIRERYFV